MDVISGPGTLQVTSLSGILTTGVAGSCRGTLWRFDIAFSPDGRRMVSGGDKLIVWDTATWQQLADYKLPLHDITFIKFSPDGNDLITSDAAALRLWRAASFKEIANREARLGRWQ